MIALAIYLYQACIEVVADLVEDSSQSLVMVFGKHNLAVLGDKHQMDVQVKNTMSAGSDIS